MRTHRLRLGILSISGLFAALLGLALLWPALLPRIVYMSRPLPPEHRSPAVWQLIGEEVSFQSSDEVALHGWFLPADASGSPVCGTVLFLHGNAGNVASHVGFTPLFRRHGLDVLLFDYRGYGASEGEPSEEGLYRDARAAYQYLIEERRVPSDRLLLVGHSLGTAVGAKIASEAEVAGLVLAAPFTSFPNVIQERLPWLPVELLRWNTNRFDALVSVQALSAPTLMAVATEDEMIPVADARVLFHAAPEPRVWVEVAGGHNEIFHGEAFRREFVAFIEATLGCARTPSDA